MPSQDKNNQIIIYNTEDGETKIEARVEGKTVRKKLKDKFWKK